MTLTQFKTAYPMFNNYFNDTSIEVLNVEVYPVPTYPNYILVAFDRTFPTRNNLVAKDTGYFKINNVEDNTYTFNFGGGSVIKTR